MINLIRREFNLAIESFDQINYFIETFIDPSRSRSLRSLSARTGFALKLAPCVASTSSFDSLHSLRSLDSLHSRRDAHFTRVISQIFLQRAAPFANAPSPSDDSFVRSNRTAELFTFVCRDGQFSDVVRPLVRPRRGFKRKRTYP